MKTGFKENTNYNWEGVNNTPGLTTKEIAKIIRQQLKEDFPKAKWSITTDYNSIHIALMSYDRPLAARGYVDIKATRIELNQAINQEGKVIFQRVSDIAQSFNYNDSDSYRDYSDVGFYLSLTIGKYDRPFVVKP